MAWPSQGEPVSDPSKDLDSTVTSTIPHTPMTGTMGGAETAQAGQSVTKSPLIFARLRREIPLPSRWTMRAMLATLYLVMFLAGWNDASQGPLLPSLQRKYDVNYLTISVIWICNFVGFISAGVANVFLTDRIGFGLAAPLGAGSQALAYVLLCWGPPFPLFLIAYIFNGFGLGLQDAQVNSLVTRVENAEQTMFLMHAMYGFGATVSPLISTEFVKKYPNNVTLYFAVSLALAAVTTFMLLAVFRLRTEDQVVGQRTHEQTDPATGEKTHHATEHGDSSGKLMSILKTPTVEFMAFYLFIYVGVEVNLGGWITTFLLDERGGDDNVGYVTTGYFAGLTIGRIIFIPVTKWIGKHNSVYIYTILSIVFEILVWVVKDLIAGSVFFCIVGLLLGPIYPIVMMVVMDVIPSQLQSGTIGWIAALGQAGSAMMPFITGGISNKHGVWILQPLIIAFLGASIILWFFVPRQKGQGWRV